MAQKKKKAQPFGERLRGLRKAKGLTQTELGELVGISQRVVTYYEHEGGSPSPELLVRFAKALGLPCEVLLGLKQPVATTEPADNLRLQRRFRRLGELPTHDQKAVLRMIDALADHAGRRKAG